jgi:hypothetical protein
MSIPQWFKYDIFISSLLGKNVRREKAIIPATVSALKKHEFQSFAR